MAVASGDEEAGQKLDRRGSRASSGSIKLASDSNKPDDSSLPVTSRQTGTWCDLVALPVRTDCSQRLQTTFSAVILCHLGAHTRTALSFSAIHAHVFSQSCDKRLEGGRQKVLGRPCPPGHDS